MADPLKITVYKKESKTPDWAQDEGAGVPDWAKEGDEPKVGMAEAAGRGLLSGASFGWGDELVAALAAGKAGGAQPESVMPQVPEPGVNLQDVYREVRDQQRARNEAARAQNPWTYGVSEFAGGVAVPLPGTGFMAAGRPAAVRMGGGALQGVVGGALSGAGEAKTMEDVPAAATTGGAIGGIVGAPLAAVAPTLTQFVTGPIRSFFRPEEQAGRLVAETATRAGFGRPFTPAMRERQLAPTERVPEGMVADYLGVPGQQLTRWAKNVSPEAAQILETETSQRARGAFGRLEADFRQRYGISDNALDAQRLQAEAARTNSPLYQLAMLHGARGVDSPELAAITQAPAVQEAMGGVVQSLANRAVGQRTGFSANASRDSLAYWDQVKRGLDSQIGRAERAGDRALVSELTPVKQRLVQELDRLVPEYNAARANARMYFGQENAIEAGEEFMRNARITPTQGHASVAQMPAQEAQAFRQAAINEFMRQTSRITGQGPMTGRISSMWDKINNSPDARGKLELILGTNGLRQLEAMQRVELIMNWTRRAAMGGSSTFQNMATGALLGAGGGYTVGDLGGMLPGASTGALLMMGARGVRSHLNDQVAQQVAHMLTSGDPAMLQRVISLAASNNNLMQWIRNLSSSMAVRGSAREAVGQANVPEAAP